MTLKKRLQFGAASLICFAAISTAAAAATPHALSPDDAEHYVKAFQDVDRGDFIDAEMQATAIKDKSLVGYISFGQLMHPTAHKAAFDELSDWLAKFRDLPVADRVFNLAAKRKPADAAAPPQPALLIGPDTLARTAPPPMGSERAQMAREAYFAGDLQRALDLAPAAGERFIAGLAAYRLNRLDQAERYFAELARDHTQDAWTRAGGAFWAARSAESLGQPDRAKSYLRAAAESPDTFYGMIAERKLSLAADAPPTIDSLIQASYTLPPPEVSAFVHDNSRAHRAAALAQIGRLQECGEELRAGLALAHSDEERARWTKLAATLGVPTFQSSAIAGEPRIAAISSYPTPDLEPLNGFTVDKALVYAIVRQESAFNPGAVSPKGAVGLMQLMPESAARASGDDALKADASPLFGASFNLRVGQDYVTWLMQHGMGYDLLRIVAAYNGGPGLVTKTAQQLGPGADDLLLIESIPAFETRAYVQKVMAGYWTYRRLFGEGTRSLDALAGGAAQADARLDLSDPVSALAQNAAQSLQVGGE